MWQAGVTPTSYAGGDIAVVQLVALFRTFDLADGKLRVCNTQGQYYLDGRFAYGGVIKSVNETLKGNDSPGMALVNTNGGNDPIFVRADDLFETYLMYKPSGNDSIWVSLSMLTCIGKLRR